MMALLPSGALANDFVGIWGPDWEELADVLVRSSLIVRIQWRFHHQIVVIILSFYLFLVFKKNVVLFVYFVCFFKI